MTPAVYKSTIDIKYVLSKAFESGYVHEVYVNTDFALGDIHPEVVILVTDDSRSVNLYTNFMQMYPLCKACSITCNPRHPATAGKKIIYRDGKWYV